MLKVLIDGQAYEAVVLVDPATGTPVAPGGGSGLTDTELRATPVPVSVSGVATSALQTALNTALGPATARAAVTDPAAAADISQLLRGILTALNAQTVLLQTIATNTTPP